MVSSYGVYAPFPRLMERQSIMEFCMNDASSETILRDRSQSMSRATVMLLAMPVVRVSESPRERISPSRSSCGLHRRSCTVYVDSKSMTARPYETTSRRRVHSSRTGSKRAYLTNCWAVRTDKHSRSRCSQGRAADIPTPSPTHVLTISPRPCANPVLAPNAACHEPTCGVSLACSWCSRQNCES